jgi:hypothetical protein
MIAPFGIAAELEPSVLSIGEGSIRGIHLTLLCSDGTGKAGTGRDKLMIGRSSGWPVCLAAPNDLLGLAIAEGIEDALSITEATGLGAWAAGSATRLPKLAPRVPNWVNCVTVVADADPTGIKNADALVVALRRAGRRADLVLFGSQRD